jgi:hypothetical protein
VPRVATVERWRRAVSGYARVRPKKAQVERELEPESDCLELSLCRVDVIAARTQTYK